MKPVIVVAASLLLAPPAGTAAPAPSPSMRGVALARVGERSARVELRVYPAAVDVAQAPRAILLNTGDVRVDYNYLFRLERKTSDGWRWVNRGQGWILLPLVLRPGKTSRPERIGVYRTNPKASRCPRSSEPCCLRVVRRPGVYRVTKGVGFAEGRRMVIRATFRVLERATGTAE